MSTLASRGRGSLRATAAVTVVVWLLLAVAPQDAGAALPAAGVTEERGDGLVPAVRFSGDNRYGTSRLIATDAGDSGPAFSGAGVILANGERFPDALAGSLLAGLESAPIVLTPAQPVASPSGPALHPDTRAALDFYDRGGDGLLPRQLEVVYLLGGEAAISSAVAELVLDRYPYAFVVRLHGEDRHETAAAVAEYGAAFGPGAERTAIVARGDAFADALAAGPLSAAQGFPILLSEAGQLPPSAATTLQRLRIEKVLVAGGPAAIAPAVVAQIEQIVGEGAVARVEGPDRFATAAAFADLAVGEYGFAATRVNLASGRAFPDGLALGPHAALGLAGDDPAPILLTDSTHLPEATRAHLEAIAGCEVSLLHAAGGTQALPAAVLRQARAAATAAGAPCTLHLEAPTGTTPAGDPVEIRAWFEHNGQAVADGAFTYEFAVEGPSGTTPPAATLPHTTGSGGVFRFTAPGAGSYAVTVRATGGGATFTEQVTVTLGPPPETPLPPTPDPAPVETVPPPEPAEEPADAADGDEPPVDPDQEGPPLTGDGQR